MSTNRFSQRGLRVASSCAVAALCCLSPLGLAQKQSSSFRAPEKPIFEDELTRKALGDIPNLSDQDTAEARMTPDSKDAKGKTVKGHMVIMSTPLTGAVTHVWCPPGAVVELAPDLDYKGFTPIGIGVWENGQQTQAHDIEKNASLFVGSAPNGGNRNDVWVQVYDAQHKFLPLLHCILYARIEHSAVASLEYTKEKEQCGFKIKDRQRFTNTCLYMGDMYLGRVDTKAGQIDMDERRLPPNNYTCQAVGRNEDDILVPGESSAFTVDKRYHITCADAENEKKIVIGEHSDGKLKVTVAHTPGLSIKKTRVSIAGGKPVEKEGDDFTVALPAEKVPDGKCFIEVVGVAEDGVTYPVESLAVNIKNELWEQTIAHRSEYVHAKENEAKIDALWQDVCANLKRADFEPSIYADSVTFTLAKITVHYKVGKKGEFQAAAAKEFMQIAQLQLEAANLYRDLELRGLASALFYRVWKEVGTENPYGDKAKRALDAIRKEASTL